ncbi:hypothetical protein [Sulfitobacter sp. SK012]|uniref:hypothetical protein n=1 Tax=Sulfitobacter sp. SK012 TaxID=1389005 RepID=UPI001577055E|nr:hypothetical protein [Sulfitobacter sp. SK012]
MKRLSLLLVLTALSACGVDGEPVRPTVDGAVTLSNSGVRVGGVLGINKGPLSVGLGF